MRVFTVFEMSEDIADTQNLSETIKMLFCGRTVETIIRDINVK